MPVFTSAIYILLKTISEISMDTNLIIGNQFGISVTNIVLTENYIQCCKLSAYK